MPRGPHSFKQGDVKKAVKGAVAAGIEVERVEVDADGKIVIFADRGERLGQPRDDNEWNDVV